MIRTRQRDQHGVEHIVEVAHCCELLLSEGLKDLPQLRKSGASRNAPKPAQRHEQIAILLRMTEIEPRLKAEATHISSLGNAQLLTDAPPFI